MGVELTQTANITGKVITPLKIDRTLTQEYMCADAKATGDAIRKIEEDNAIQEINVIAQPNISSTVGVCYKRGRICQFVVDFTTTETIIHDVPLYIGLPTPMVDIDFVVHTMDGVMYWLKILKKSEKESKIGICKNFKQEIPSGTRLVGTVTYITTD